LRVDALKPAAVQSPGDSLVGDADDSSFLRHVTASLPFQCPACAARVGVLARPVCPHCGEALVLDVGVGEGGLSRVWAALAVAMSLSAGTGLFILLIVLKEGWPGSSRGGTTLLQASLAYFLASIPLALLAIFKRRAFRRLPDTLQQVLLLVGWAGTIAAFLELLSAIH
jgi:hypothetical protein